MRRPRLLRGWYWRHCLVMFGLRIVGAGYYIVAIGQGRRGGFLWRHKRVAA